MNGYATAAIQAAVLVAKEGKRPQDAWHEVLALSDKACPKSTFLSLCEAGDVVGVPRAPPGTYTRASQNRENAEMMVRILREAKEPLTVVALWNEAQRALGRDTAYEQQADVVLGLWNAGLIRP